MNEPKSIINSATIQGIVALLSTGVYLIFKVEVGEGERSALETAILSLILLAGTVRAVIGRIKANRNLKLGNKLL